jgi:hypothetical protein
MAPNAAAVLAAAPLVPKTNAGRSKTPVVVPTSNPPLANESHENNSHVAPVGCNAIAPVLIAPVERDDDATVQGTPTSTSVCASVVESAASISLFFSPLVTLSGPTTTATTTVASPNQLAGITGKSSSRVSSPINHTAENATPPVALPPLATVTIEPDEARIGHPAAVHPAQVDVVLAALPQCEFMQHPEARAETERDQLESLNAPPFDENSPTLAGRDSIVPIGNVPLITTATPPTAITSNQPTEYQVHRIYSESNTKHIHAFVQFDVVKLVSPTADAIEVLVAGVIRNLPLLLTPVYHRTNRSTQGEAWRYVVLLLFPGDAGYPIDWHVSFTRMPVVFPSISNLQFTALSRCG